MFSLLNSTKSVVFVDGEKRLRIAFVGENIARVTLTEGKAFQTRPSLIVTAKAEFSDFQLRETAETFEVFTSALKLVIKKATGAISYFNPVGQLLLREPDRGGKSLVSKKVYRNVFNQSATVDAGQSIDGARAAATEFETVFDRDAFEAKLEFEFAPDEAVFGLGSHEEGYGNLRGKERLLYQQNMKIVVPYFVSTRGYGVLLDW